MSDRVRRGLAGLAGLLLFAACTDEPEAPPSPTPVPDPPPSAAIEELTATDPAIVGRLVDSLGQPIAGGLLHLLDADRDSAAAGGGTAASDSSGRFRMPPPHPRAPLLLVVTHTRFPPRILDVTPGADLGEVVLTSALGCTVEVRRSDTLALIEDARVRIEPVLFDARLSAPDLLVRTATSGPDGLAQLYAVPPGTWRMRIEAPGLVPIELPHVQPTAPARPPRRQVALLPGHRLVGRAVMPDGTAAVGARVEVRFGDDHGAAASTRAGEDGSFRLTGLPDGLARVRAWVEPDLIGEAEEVAIPAQGSVRIRLHRGSPLTGSVVDAQTGAPLAGVEVTATRTAGGQITDRTDAAGRFAIGAAIVGRWNIRATSNGRVPVRIGPVDLPIDEPLEMSLDRAIEIAGIVLDPSGRPLPGAEIQVMPASFDGSALAMFAAKAQRPRSIPGRSEVDGTFRAAAPRAPIRILARAPGFAPYLTTVIDPRQANAERIEVWLERGSRLIGIARRADGSPAAGVRVCADPVGTADRPRVAAETKTDADGHFTFGPLSAGPYEVFYYSEDRSRSAGELASESTATRTAVELSERSESRCELTPR